MRAHQRGSSLNDNTEELPSDGGAGEVGRRSSVARRQTAAVGGGGRLLSR
jgi:hypothetical protein